MPTRFSLPRTRVLKWWILGVDRSCRNSPFYVFTNVIRFSINHQKSDILKLWNCRSIILPFMRFRIVKQKMKKRNWQFAVSSLSWNSLNHLMEMHQWTVWVVWISSTSLVIKPRRKLCNLTSFEFRFKTQKNVLISKALNWITRKIQFFRHLVIIYRHDPATLLHCMWLISVLFQNSQ